MPIEFKLSISFIFIGISNLILASNRNWIFGYRSPRAIKTHKSYAYANRLYGSAMTLIGSTYFTVLSWFPNIYGQYPDKWHLIVVISYFALTFLLIEIKMHKHFRE
ncbi:MAG: SdpI family protein [Cyclobacteriaceae bacterium]